jgi:hypothetical protein
MSLSETRTTREGRPEFKSVATKTLIEANNLDYTVPPSLSVAVQRRHIRNEAQSITYSDGRTCNIVLNSGDDYCMGKSSYLSITVQSQGGTNVGFGSGSVLNLFKTMKLYHSSGVEIERLENVNLYRRFVHKYTKSEEWFCTVGSMMGYTQNDANIYGTDLGSGPHTFVIPLSELSGFFNTGKLIPSFLLSGMRVSIDLAAASEALVGRALLTANDALSIPTSYTVSDVAIVLDATTIADVVQDKLNQTSSSSKNGTEFHWKCYSHSPKTISQASLHISAEKAVSRASRAFCIVRRTANVNKGNLDAMVPEQLDMKSYQFRLGSMFFPNKTLTNSVEFYHNAIFAFDNFSTDNQTCVPFKDFKGFDDVKHVDATAGNLATAVGSNVAIVLPSDVLYKAQGQSESAAVVALERSEGSLSGLPVSGSRSLTLDATFANSAARTIDMFLEYTKVSSSFLYDRVILKE